jgi:integrase/recombinase XerD
MNRSSSGLPLSKAMDGFLRFKVVEGLSDTTIVSYRALLGCFLDHGHDIQLATIESHDIEDFFYWLRTDYVPQRITGSSKPLSPKTVYNFWVSLKSFFAWAYRQEFINKN